MRNAGERSLAAPTHRSMLHQNAKAKPRFGFALFLYQGVIFAYCAREKTSYPLDRGALLFIIEE